jgi:RNA polymerase sigma-70 factor, ECF subfamily
MYNRRTRGTQPAVDYSAISAEELFLTCLRGGEESAWLEFVRRFHHLIASVVLRAARQWGQGSPAVVDDLVQETYLKLCGDRVRLLQNFQPTHKDAAYGYVKIFTAHLAQDYFKSLRAKKRGGSATTSSLEVEGSKEGPREQEPGASMLERNLLIRQIATCLENAVSSPTGERDRRIFWLYYRAGLAASEIAALPTIGLSIKGVETTILRLTRIVRQKLISPKQADSPARESAEGIRPAESL